MVAAPRPADKPCVRAEGGFLDSVDYSWDGFARNLQEEAEEVDPSFVPLQRNCIWKGYTLHTRQTQQCRALRLRMNYSSSTPPIPQ